jgi:hypothetical protein
MYKLLFWVNNYVYKACNPTILNLSKVKEKISLGLLDYRPKINYSSLFGLCYNPTTLKFNSHWQDWSGTESNLSQCSDNILLQHIMYDIHLGRNSKNYNPVMHVFTLTHVRLFPVYTSDLITSNVLTHKNHNTNNMLYQSVTWYWTASCIEPRCTGICGALDTRPPSGPNKAQEKSNLSLIFVEIEVLCKILQ